MAGCHPWAVVPREGAMKSGGLTRPVGSREGQV